MFRAKKDIRPLTLNRVSVVRGGRTLMHNLSISIFPGTAVLFVGKNGIGKTSLMEDLVCKIENAQEKVGYLGDDSILDDELTLEANLFFFAEIHGAEMKISAMIHTLKLGDYLENKVMHLSKGIKRRANIGLLLLQDKRVWIMDEPFANLDLEATNIVISMINAKSYNGGVVIFTSPVDFMNFNELRSCIKMNHMVRIKMDNFVVS